MLTRYENDRDDSARWGEITLRGGDVVVATPIKAGTTWLQRICLLLILRRADLPAHLGELSPWVDMRMAPIDAVRAQLERQPGRRVIKTHTPLDGVPMRADVTYVVGARHPLDVALSTYHQWRNIDLDVVRRTLGITTAEMPDPEPVDPATWLAAWIREEVEDLRTEPHSLQHLMWHLSDAWERRTEPNVALLHYADLSGDLAGQVGELAARMGVEPIGAGLLAEAGFARMRERADELVPGDVPFKDRAAFFREGRSGGGAALLSDEDLAVFHRRVGELAAPGLAEWLLR